MGMTMVLLLHTEASVSLRRWYQGSQYVINPLLARGCYAIDTLDCVILPDCGTAQKHPAVTMRT